MTNGVVRITCPIITVHSDKLIPSAEEKKISKPTPINKLGSIIGKMNTILSVSLILNWLLTNGKAAAVPIAVERKATEVATDRLFLKASITR
jgi:hypothetical protein